MHGMLARIEAGQEDLPELVKTDIRRQISEKFREIGFAYVTVDLEGYRMGSMNEVLP